MTPTDDSKKKNLWRYMPIAGLLNLLQTKELHLTRADKFEDILEGQFGFVEICKDLGLDHKGVASPIMSALKAECFLSCWHWSAAESLGMWRTYGQQIGASVAVVSDVGQVMKVANAFCEEFAHSGMFGEVIYDNYVVSGKMSVGTMQLPFGTLKRLVPISAQLLFCKAPAFDFEKEWRLVIWKKMATKEFVRLPLPDIAQFLKRVVVSPEAPDWVEETIRNVVQIQFGLSDVPVERSSLRKHLRA